jgi:hypothetical protein
MIVLQRLGINIAPLVAGLGVTGFILGFAFQESLGNLAAGMMIALNQPFKVGDYIIAGGTEGSVKELKMMAEYDSDGVNVGAAVRLWKHLSMHAFTHDFTCVSGGIRYECTLIH